MTAVAVTLSRSTWIGLTVYVAFLLMQSASASGPTDAELSDAASDFSDAAADALLGGDRSDRSEGIRFHSEDEPSASDASSSMMPPPPIGTPTPYGPLPPPSPPFRDTVYGAHANPGPPGGPSYLHPNLPDYQTKYGIWYQPRSFWEPRREVYRPSPFRPRGWGNLFNDDPCRRDRMDYNRYVVKDLPSRYGPSYYPLYQPPGECLVRPERHYTPPVWGAAE
ncbi:MAG: hypothetical protein WBC44_06025 [Planctomycetaceae bacterium]